MTRLVLTPPPHTTTHLAPQVQLQNLTQSFQANTAEMKERITRAGASGNLTQVLGASPPSPAGIFFSTSLPERSSASALSSSLPMPITIASRKPSSGQINGRQSASGRPGLLSEQLGARGTMSPHRGADTPPGTCATEFPDDEGPAVPVANGRPAANGAGPLANGHLSQHHADRLDRSTNGSAGSRWGPVAALLASPVLCLWLRLLFRHGQLCQHPLVPCPWCPATLLASCHALHAALRYTQSACSRCLLLCIHLCCACRR